MVQYNLWGTEVDLDLAKGTFPTENEIRNMDDQLFNCTHGYFQTPTAENNAYGGIKLHYRKFTPSAEHGPPKGVCVYQHGIHSEGGLGCILNGRLYRYSLLSKMFTQCGYILYILDLRGHGFSEGTRFYIPNSDWTVNRDDLKSFALYVSHELEDSNLPFFLMGESYGGCLTLHISRQWMNDPKVAPSNFRGICLLSPAVIAEMPPPPTVALLSFLAGMFPRWEPFFLPHPIPPTRVYKNETIMKEFNSKRRQMMRLSSVGRKFYLGTALGLVNSIKKVREDAIPGLSVPFYVVHGTQDIGVPMEGTQFLLKHAKTPLKDRCSLFVEGGYHDLLCEETKELIVGSIIDWMESRRWKAAFSFEQ